MHSNSSNQIKSIIVLENSSIKKVNDALNELNNTKFTYENFRKKLANGSIKHDEVLKIADILGYEIVWKKKEK